jgi:hypothetical protein
VKKALSTSRRWLKEENVMGIKRPNSAFTAAVGLAVIVTTMTACSQKEASTPAPTQTTDTPLGNLSFPNGFPTEETTQKLFDELDYQRAVQAYLWAYPAVSFESIRLGALRDLGADLNDFVIADNYADPKAVWLTANDTTIYGLTNVDLGKAGPLVIEIPPGAIVGILDDFWQRSLTDLGLPGPDGPKGGKFLLLPPGYKGNAPETGYHVLQGTMNNYNVMIRGIVQNDDKDAAVANVKKVKVYPLSDSRNPKLNKFFTMSGKASNTLPPRGIEFWERLSAVINNNPVHERDVFFMGMLKPLGIEKGKEFKPDARQRKILEEAARIGDAMGRVMLFEGPDRFRQAGRSRIRAVPRNEVALGVPGESRPENRYVRPDRRAAALHLRRDLHDARAGRNESRPGWKLHAGVQGQGRQPPRWREIISSECTCERAGRAVLVADAV